MLMQYNPTPNPSNVKSLSLSSPRNGGNEGGARRGNLAPISVYSRGGLGGEVSRMYFTQSGIAISLAKYSRFQINEGQILRTNPDAKRLSTLFPVPCCH